MLHPDNSFDLQNHPHDYNPDGTRFNSGNLPDRWNARIKTDMACPCPIAEYHPGA